MKISSDSRRFSNWITSPTSNPDMKPNSHDLSLGFNPGPTRPMWPTPLEMGMDIFPYNNTTIADITTTADVRNRGVDTWQQIDGTITAAPCRDCGNQSKKDCSHERCRTCCKGRGFHCATHVNSTWHPSSKKPRFISSRASSNSNSISNTITPAPSFDFSSVQQDAKLKEKLPRQVKALAVFKCVKVTAVGEGDDEVAYQAMVTIGGHMFKGFLYDQGVIDPKEEFPNLSELHLGGGIDQSDVYGVSSGGGGGFLGGASYGNTI